VDEGFGWWVARVISKIATDVFGIFAEGHPADFVAQFGKDRHRRAYRVARFLSSIPA
jgi:hypothetical protein